MDSNNSNINITVLYSSDESDQKYFQELFPHLQLLMRRYPNVNIWHRADIIPGQPIEEHIRQEVDQSDLVLLLLSPLYIVDELIDSQTKHLLKNFNKKSRRDTRYIMPIILRSFNWEDVYDPQYDLEALPVLSTPISSTSVENRDEIFTNIITKLESQIKKMIEHPMRIILPAWVGNIGVVSYNNGLKKNTKTELYQKYQRIIEIELNDSIFESCEAWKAGKYDLICTTLDCLPLVLKELEDFEPKIIFQTSWSKGADAIVGRGDVKTILDLKGKNIICATDSPSYSFLQFALQSEGMTLEDVQLRYQQINHPDKAIKYFLNDTQIDAIVLWSPYLEYCLREGEDTKVITDTSSFPSLITDVLISSENYIQLNREELVVFLEGWLNETRASEEDKINLEKAIQILVDSILDSFPQIIPRALLQDISKLLVTYFNMSADKIHLCNLDDNLHFFGILPKTENSQAPSVEDLMNPYAILPGFEDLVIQKCLESSFIQDIYTKEKQKLNVES